MPRGSRYVKRLVLRLRMHAAEEDMKHQVQLLHARAKKATMNYGYPAAEQPPHNVEDVLERIDNSSMTCTTNPGYVSIIGIIGGPGRV